MARPKKPKYEYVESLGRYRKRIKDADGKYVAIYGNTPEELTAKLADAQRQIERAHYNRENPTVGDYADKWLTLQEPYLRSGTVADYRSIIKIYIKAPIGHLRLQEVRPDDVKEAMRLAALKSASVYGRANMLIKKPRAAGRPSSERR